MEGASANVRRMRRATFQILPINCWGHTHLHLETASASRDLCRNSSPPTSPPEASRTAQEARGGRGHRGVCLLVGGAGGQNAAAFQGAGEEPCRVRRRGQIQVDLILKIMQKPSQQGLIGFCELLLFRKASRYDNVIGASSLGYPESKSPSHSSGKRFNL